MVYVQCRIKTWVLVASAQGPRSELQVWSSVVPSARWTTPGAASVVHRRRPEATRTLCCETLFVPLSALVGIKQRMQVTKRLCVCVVSEHCMGSRVWGRGASSRFFEKKCATGPHITFSPWFYSSRAPCPGYSDLIRCWLHEGVSIWRRCLSVGLAGTVCQSECWIQLHGHNTQYQWFGS